ncbi:hypothetical protein A8926_3897 [Saccharopolyspora spinosa]|uniref:Uncharacterized protein n=1 Tax=Saccharopolyspora spinosa TaxID=60894 RepID=A0A2N3XZK6_SACSN|nr:hypothetical protein A8926_3897 [Saccharopolyspora spinosa]
MVPAWYGLVLRFVVVVFMVGFPEFHNFLVAFLVGIPEVNHLVEVPDEIEGLVVAFL